MKILITVLIFTALSFFTGECTADTSASIKNADKIVYRFGDSSLPPDYHRSYTITITKSEARLAVDSYGKVLEEKTVKVTEKEFNEIIETVSAAKISKRQTVENKGCAGGTTESLKLLKADKELFTASVYHCGREDFGDLAGDIKAVKAKVAAFFRETENRLK